MVSGRKDSGFEMMELRYRISRKSRVKNLISSITLITCLLMTLSVPSLAVGQAGLDIAVLKAGVGARPLGRGGLAVPPAEENQITGNQGQNQSGNCQVNIGFHNYLFPPLAAKNEIENNCDNTADNSGKKIGISNVPFNHVFTSLASSKESKKNTAVIIDERINERRKSKMLRGRMSIADYNNIGKAKRQGRVGWGEAK